MKDKRFVFTFDLKDAERAAMLDRLAEIMRHESKGEVIRILIEDKYSELAGLNPQREQVAA